MSGSSPLLEVTGMGKQFGNLKAVDDVDFTINRGEIVGLIGPNGAGKTTLFNTLNGVYTPDSGTISIDGRTLKSEATHEICHLGIGRCFQIVRTFNSMTVIENVVAGGVFGSGRKDISTAREKAREYVDFVGLGGHEDTPVSELTVANRRQVELARSLATDPKLILLDEVATGLNPSEVEEMTDTIDRLRNEYEVSVLWIEHIMDAIMSTVDRVIVLHHGQKIADGTPEEVQQNEAVIEAYFGGEL